MKKIFFVLIFFVLLPCKSVFSAEAAYDENVYQAVVPRSSLMNCQVK